MSLFLAYFFPYLIAQVSLQQFFFFLIYTDIVPSVPPLYYTPSSSEPVRVRAYNPSTEPPLPGEAVRVRALFHSLSLSLSLSDSLKKININLYIYIYMYIYGYRYGYGTKYFQNIPPGFLRKSGFCKVKNRMIFGHFFN
jgi:hypothetical protein